MPASSSCTTPRCEGHTLGRHPSLLLLGHVVHQRTVSEPNALVVCASDLGQEAGGSMEIARTEWSGGNGEKAKMADQRTVFYYCVLVSCFSICVLALCIRIVY